MQAQWLKRSLVSLVILGALAVGSPIANAVTISAGSSASVSADVTAFRQDTSALLKTYYADYSDRLSAAEKINMAALMAQVDAELGILHRKAAASARLSRTHATAARQRAAARIAAAAYDQAYARAIASLERVQPILQPKLSLFEALRAKSDLDRAMSTFEQLGVRIHQLSDQRAN
ncbi:MAG: hypothetical protein WC005_11545 [Candidatus Nanopelagicales bacterium]